MNKKVNLFLVGAPKCGTTSLAQYLSYHPDIFLSKVKEPHYFAHQHILPPVNDYYNNFDKYSELFNSEVGQNATYRLDASVWYYIHKAIAKDIFKYNPNAKILMLIRNPFEAIKSLYNHRVMALEEDILDINKAIELEKMRKLGSYIPKGLKKTSQGLFYSENYKYADKIENYISVFGKDQVKVLLFDDLVMDKEKLLNDIFDFLGIEKMSLLKHTEKVFNKSIGNRNFTLNKFIKLLPVSIKRPFSSFFRNVVEPNILNKRPNKPFNDNISDKTKERLMLSYVRDWQLIEEKTNVNLNFWRK